MAVTMTERAAKHVAGFIEKRGKGVGLRLGVRTTGCSGTRTPTVLRFGCCSRRGTSRVAGSRNV